MSNRSPYRPGKTVVSDVITSVRFTSEEAAVIRHLARYHHMTVSELIRRAVIEHHSLMEYTSEEVSHRVYTHRVEEAV